MYACLEENAQVVLDELGEAVLLRRGLERDQVVVVAEDVRAVPSQFGGAMVLVAVQFMEPVAEGDEGARIRRAEVEHGMLGHQRGAFWVVRGALVSEMAFLFVLNHGFGGIL